MIIDSMISRRMIIDSMIFHVAWS